jgi:recombination protein RecA
MKGDPVDMTSHNETAHTIKTLVAAIEKQFGKGSIMSLGEDATPTDICVIPTGSLALDHALGIGGYPRGRIVEIYGPESSGKTTLALHALRGAQRAGGVAAFIDAEHAFDINYAKSVGVDEQRLLVSQPDNGEQALDIVEMLTRSGAVDVIAIDSVAALTPKVEIEGDMGDSQVGQQSRLMSLALRKLTAVAHKAGTLLLFLNQLRHKNGVIFGSTETTTGGNALKFYASVRLDVRRVGPIKVGEVSVGCRTRAKVVKNKCAVPFKEAEFDIRWGTGIDWAGDLLDVALTLGVVEKSGAHFMFCGETLGQGREQVREMVRRDSVGEKLRNAVDAAYRHVTEKSAPQ